jgi:hypothetical protein
MEALRLSIEQSQKTKRKTKSASSRSRKPAARKKRSTAKR